MPKYRAIFINSSQDSAERGKTRSKRSALTEKDMARAMSDEEDRSGEVAASRIPDEFMKIAGKPIDEFAAMAGTDAATFVRERPGMSAFVYEDGAVYHTYSTYARGLDALWGMYQWLDRAPLGRNESNIWWRRHDEYDAFRSK